MEDGPIQLYRQTSLFDALHEALDHYVKREDLPDTLQEEAQRAFDEVRSRGEARRPCAARALRALPLEATGAARRRVMRARSLRAQAIRTGVASKGGWTQSASETPLIGKIKVRATATPARPQRRATVRSARSQRLCLRS